MRHIVVFAALIALTALVAAPGSARGATYRSCSTGSTPSSLYGLKRYGMTCTQARSLLRKVDKRLQGSGSAQTLPRSVDGYSCTYKRSAGIDFTGRCFSRSRNEGIRFSGAFVDA